MGNGCYFIILRIERLISYTVSGNKASPRRLKFEVFIGYFLIAIDFGGLGVISYQSQGSQPCHLGILFIFQDTISLLLIVGVNK